MAGSPFYLLEEKSFYGRIPADSSPLVYERTVAERRSYINWQKDANGGLRSSLATVSFYKSPVTLHQHGTTSL